MQIENTTETNGFLRLFAEIAYLDVNMSYISNSYNVLQSFCPLCDAVTLRIRCFLHKFSYFLTLFTYFYQPEKRSWIISAAVDSVRVGQDQNNNSVLLRTAPTVSDQFAKESISPIGEPVQKNRLIRSEKSDLRRRGASGDNRRQCRAALCRSNRGLCHQNTEI